MKLTDQERLRLEVGTKSTRTFSTRTLDTFRDALIVFDNSLQITDLNLAAERLFQVPRNRAMNRLLIEVVRDHRLEQLALEAGELELDWSGKLLRVRSLKSDAGAGSLICEDLTETRTRERELREVMAILSHEFRTPVTAVKGLLEALQLDPPAEIQKRFLELSLIEVERLVRLSEDLTVGFRPQAQRSFPLADAINRVLRLLKEELEKRRVTVMVQANLVVHCDPDKLVQVLLNLLENALRHGPNPGEVRLQASLENQLVSVTVRDAGLELATYGHIFEAHKRGPNSNGSGMGLYVVRSIVMAWQGETWGRYDGTGNEFGFTVPALQFKP